MLRHGFSIKGISEKSAKFEGVSQTANAGASLEELMWLGRWKSLTTPNHYKNNDENYKKILASKNSSVRHNKRIDWYSRNMML